MTYLPEIFIIISRPNYRQQFMLTNIYHKKVKLDTHNRVNIVTEAERVNNFFFNLDKLI